jgi:hypothetical protein
MQPATRTSGKKKASKKKTSKKTTQTVTAQGLLSSLRTMKLKEIRLAAKHSEAKAATKLVKDEYRAIRDELTQLEVDIAKQQGRLFA